jgi:menaquinol-cytochrome c reductase iron-sulfur subunit
MNRRTWLSGIVAATGAVVAATVAIPSVIVSLAPVLERRRREVWRPVGSLSEFPPESIRKVVVDQRTTGWNDAVADVAVYVWRAAEEEVVVFSRACTDLGCPVTWDPGSEWFFCPCHGGIFAKDGRPTAGPPPRPLYRYATRINNGVVEIDVLSLPPEA